MPRPAVLVTGGARRIGEAIVRRFAAEGWHVVIHCHASRAEADALASELPSAEVVSCDLADTAATLTMIEHLAQRLDDWRVLVNSASVFRPDDARLPLGLRLCFSYARAARPQSAPYRCEPMKAHVSA